MVKDPQRPVPLDEHPLRKRTYRVPTPSIAALRTLVDECLFLYISGAIVHGRPRMGKSYAIDFMRHDLERRHPKLSVYKIRCARSQRRGASRVVRRSAFRPWRRRDGRS